MAEARTTTIKKPKVRWRRMIAVFVTIIACILALHAGWGWRAERLLRERVAALSAAGQRVRPSDFIPKWGEPPYPQNAAADLTAAAAIVDDDGQENKTLYYLPATRPSNEAAWPYLARARDWYEPAIRRIERAQAKPRCQFDQNLASPVSENLRLSESVNGTRELANVVALTAMVEHHEGRDDRVVRRLGQMLFLAEVNEATPSSIGHGTAQAIASAAARRVEQFEPELRIGDANGDTPAADVRKLIAALVDERTVQTGFDNAIQADRMTTLDSLDSLARGVTTRRKPEFDGIIGYLFRPYLLDNARVALAHDTAVIDAVRGQGDWPTTASRLARVTEIPRRYLFAAVFTREPERSVRWHFISLTDRRLAATALAIRLYQVDHAGARPQRLEELVPAYLPAVPRDAMASGARPIGYVPSAEHPVLYSVGRDGNDESANEKPMPHEFGEIDEWQRLDRVFYLSSRPREVIYIERPQRNLGPGVAAAGMPPAVWEPEGFTGPPWEEPPKAAAAAAAQPASR